VVVEVAAVVGGMVVGEVREVAVDGVVVVADEKPSGRCLSTSIIQSQASISYLGSHG